MIYIDGIVGVGKSTLAEILAKELNLSLYKEPVYDNPILEKFYYDKKKYSFPLQVFFLNKRLEMVKEAHKNGGGIFDRAIYCDKIFADILYKDGDLIEDEYNLYLELTKNMFENLPKPKVLVYLETTVDKAIEKIARRGREFEKNVDRKYWEELHGHYKKYFEEYSESTVIKINVDNRDFLNNREDVEYILNLVRGELCK
ncbi:Deoxyadenosine/deoxycytidine kinase [Cetobacterium ceti]|uniref:Deoxyadenosine/deoxycytidine kinase n=1 Tax=Cetobacterium ceti TaxID=180163 RepID=A0A1T4K4L7_9FUSO|nr:deoxynucleoside kinase [Cetobacterium ceti]SJZ37267.1 Deoxyadenosine/deoxycytidine kinase [Cetobacterium ceti]